MGERYLHIFMKLQATKMMCSRIFFYWSVLLASILSCVGASCDEEQLSPINIITSEVKYSYFEKPVSIIVKLPFALVDVTLENRGDALISRLISPVSPVIFTGPFLENVKYALDHETYYVNQSLGRSGHEINGKGLPLESLKVCYNLKYKNLKNATNYDDGILVFSQPVAVTDFVNPLFFEYQAKLGEVKNPNSTTIITSPGSFFWYDSFLFTHSIFKYKGCYYDPVTKEQISNALQLVGQPPYNTISYTQFAAYRDVMGNDGKPLNSITPIYPQGSRKVEAARGVSATYVPPGISLYLP